LNKLNVLKCHTTAKNSDEIMITLIGTGHVFNLSQALINIFDEKQPDIICVELDKQRYKALIMKQLNPEKYKEQSKNQPILYKLLSRFQDGMAKEYGVTAGQEMLTAIDYAQSHQRPIALIDMEAQNLFSKMLKNMSIREKFRLILSGFGGLFVSKKRVEKELDKIQDDFDFYMDEIGKKFPTIKRTLIDERNEYMKEQLKSASKDFEKVIAVVGDGHIPGLSSLLKENEMEFETIRLKELREKPQSKIDSTNASFTHEYEDIK
jgi:pheromone shutdown protein TraB